MARIRVAVGTLECRPELDPYRRDTGGQTYAQLWLRPEARACGIAQQSGAPGVGVPMEEHTRHVLTHAIGCDEHGTYAIGCDAHYPTRYPVEAATRRYLRSRAGQALLRRVCDGWDSGWDGQNVVGILNADAQLAWGELCAALDTLTEEASYADASDWLQFDSDSGLTGRESDERLAKLAARYEREAWHGQRVVVGGMIERLTEIRDELRSAAAEDASE